MGVYRSDHISSCVCNIDCTVRFKVFSLLFVLACSTHYLCEYTTALYSQLKETLKEISPEYSLEGLMLKLKLQYSDHLMES